MGLLPEIAVPAFLSMGRIGGIVRVIGAHRPEGLVLVVATEVDVLIQAVRAVAKQLLRDSRRPLLSDLRSIEPHDGKLMDERIGAGVGLRAGQMRDDAGRRLVVGVLGIHRHAVRVKDEPSRAMRGFVALCLRLVQRRVGGVNRIDGRPAK